MSDESESDFSDMYQYVLIGTDSEEVDSEDDEETDSDEDDDDDSEDDDDDDSNSDEDEDEHDEEDEDDEEEFDDEHEDDEHDEDEGYTEHDNLTNNVIRVRSGRSVGIREYQFNLTSDRFYRRWKSYVDAGRYGEAQGVYVPSWESEWMLLKKFFEIPPDAPQTLSDSILLRMFNGGQEGSPGGAGRFFDSGGGGGSGSGSGSGSASGGFVGCHPHPHQPHYYVFSPDDPRTCRPRSILRMILSHISREGDRNAMDRLARFARNQTEMRAHALVYRSSVLIGCADARNGSVTVLDEMWLDFFTNLAREKEKEKEEEKRRGGLAAETAEAETTKTAAAAAVLADLTPRQEADFCCRWRFAVALVREATLKNGFGSDDDHRYHHFDEDGDDEDGGGGGGMSGGDGGCSLDITVGIRLSLPRLAIHTALRMGRRMTRGAGPVLAAAENCVFDTILLPPGHPFQEANRTVLELVARHFPSDAARRDPKGRSPLDVALDNYHRNRLMNEARRNETMSRSFLPVTTVERMQEDGILSLARAAPEVLLTSATGDGPSRLFFPPALLAACRDVPLNLIYRLLRMEPRIVESGIVPTERERRLERDIAVMKDRTDAVREEIRALRKLKRGHSSISPSSLMIEDDRPPPKKPWTFWSWFH